ncbi:MAG TPA: hypothetical protein VFH83_03605 [Spirochaetia bacterium]|nr:hypothetical protein [Spirochaetia bacterium]
MRKAVICAALILLCACGAFAAAGWALGGEGGFYIDGAGGLPASGMLVFHLPQVPLMFGVGVAGSPLAIGFTADYWALKGSFNRFLSGYGGFGGYATFGAPFTAGVRFPFGLQIWPIPQSLEVFLEVAPAVGLSLVPTGFDWHIQAALGLRIWF